MKTLIVLSIAALSGCSASRFSARGTLASADEPRQKLTVRAEAGVLWVSTDAATEPRRAWPMPARGQIDQLEVHAVPGGFEVHFVQAGVPYLGELDAARLPRGPLEHHGRSSFDLAMKSADVGEL